MRRLLVLCAALWLTVGTMAWAGGSRPERSGHGDADRMLLMHPPRRWPSPRPAGRLRFGAGGPFLSSPGYTIGRLLLDDRSAGEDLDFVSYTVPSPDRSRFAVLLSRTMPRSERLYDRWLLLIQNARTGVVERVFDFIRAFGIESMVWMNSTRLMILDRSIALTSPPGNLYVVDLNCGRAELVDELVWRFRVSPSGDCVVYERSENREERYGKRMLYIYKPRTRERELIDEVVHPLVQFGRIFEFDGDGRKFFYSVEKYRRDSFEPVVEKWVYDLREGKKLPVRR